MKDGKLQETEEEIPDIKITKKRYFENIPQEKETETEKKPEQKDISYPSYKDKDNIMKSDNKEENVPSSMRNKYKNRIRSDEKEKEPSTSDKPDLKEIKEFKTIEQPEEKPKEKNKTYPYSKYQGKYIKPKEEEKEKEKEIDIKKEEEKPIEEKGQKKYIYRRRDKKEEQEQEQEQPSEKTTISINKEEKPTTLTTISKEDDKEKSSDIKSPFGTLSKDEEKPQEQKDKINIRAKPKRIYKTHYQN